MWKNDLIYIFVDYVRQKYCLKNILHVENDNIFINMQALRFIELKIANLQIDQ